MQLARALRLPTAPILALAGAGGKTTALFQLARELPPPVLVAATTHLHINQIQLADSHRIITGAEILDDLHEVTVVTGPIEGERTTGINPETALRLYEVSRQRSTPLLIEADGSRRRPLKAPAEHEPVIPNFVQGVVVIAGLTGLGKPLTEEHVHRPEIFTRLSGLKRGAEISPQGLARLLTHPLGGLKGIPANARRIALLNQADTPDLQAQARGMTEPLLTAYDAVIIASLKQEQIYAIHEPTAGIILAAGDAKRFGQPKQLLTWHGQPLIRHLAQTALAAGLSPVIVVTGANSEAVAAAIQDLPLSIVHNPNRQSGQSSSLQCGLRQVPARAGSAIFLLSDQPGVTTDVLRSLVETHATSLHPIVAPQVRGQRANPVLFDRVTFEDLMSLTGDTGGRVLFAKFPPAYLPWHDDFLLVDIDYPADYRRLSDE